MIGKFRVYGPIFIVCFFLLISKDVSNFVRFGFCAVEILGFMMICCCFILGLRSVIPISVSDVV